MVFEGAPEGNIRDFRTKRSFADEVSRRPRYGLLNEIQNRSPLDPTSVSSSDDRKVNCRLFKRIEA
jgi:hypothetical protein